jgi:hypothetical protein
MDAKPPKVPPPPTRCSVRIPNWQALSFLGAELPEHVRAFLDELCRSCAQKYQ